MKKILSFLIFVFMTGFVYAQQAGELSGSSVVSLVRSPVEQASSLTYNDILELTRQAVALAGGLEGIVKPGDVVVLKPNLICSSWNWGAGTRTTMPMLVNGVMTDWRVVQAVATIVREIIGPYNPVTGRGKIMVIEGPGNSSATGSSLHHFTNMGYTLENLTAVNEIIPLETEGTWSGPGIVNAATLPYVTQVTLPNPFYTRAIGSYLRYYQNDGRYWVNKKMFEADALISIPVVKSHWSTTVTGAIKNIGIGATPPAIYGTSSTVVGRNNMVNHSSVLLHDWIADYFSCLPADFVVMDGLQGLEEGPLPNVNSAAALARYQKNLRCILASRDALAIDMVKANIIGWDYTSVPHLVKLAERGEVYARGEIGKPNGRRIRLRGNARDIVVLGNVMVDDVRGDYRATISPGNPGFRISAAKKANPTISINRAGFSGSTINLDLALSTGTYNRVVKIDVYLNGEYVKSFNTFNAGTTRVSFNAPGLASGSHRLEVRAFNDYMFSARATATAIR